MTPDRGGFAALDNCVHCGFCLQACPTFLATGDEADGPRGRIALMRALEWGELAASDPSLTTHLDRCLGCRACEPVCPSGVGYGRGLEAARERVAARRGLPPLARLALHATTSRELSPVAYALARALRATGLPRALAGWGRVRFAMGMLAASAERGARSAERGAPPGRLVDRTYAFAASIVEFVGSLPRGRVTDVVGLQLLRCGTSVGANYRAARRARSRREFIAKLGIVEEEADEACFWLDLGITCGVFDATRASALREAAAQILAMTIASIRTARRARPAAPHSALRTPR